MSTDAREDHSALYGIRRFVHTLRLDLDGVRNAITESWSNGQTEGQITRLKMLKRAMYGSAGINLLRARMMPLNPTQNRDCRKFWGLRATRAF
jgi:transposase